MVENPANPGPPICATKDGATERVPTLGAGQMWTPGYAADLPVIASQHAAGRVIFLTHI
jgi:hypothetical protein